MKKFFKWFNKFFLHDDFQPEDPATPIVEDETYFTSEQLFQIMATGWYSNIDKTIREKAEFYAGPLNKMFKRYEINSYYRICHALAQIGKESGHLTITREKGSKFYFWRRGLNPKWRGRGLIQLTHKYHYKAYQKYLEEHGPIKYNIVSNPELMCQLPLSVSSVGYYWTRVRDINPMADQGDIAIEKITKAVNGGTNGLADRKKIYEQCKKVLVGLK